MAVTDEQHLREAYNCILSARGHIEQVSDGHVRRDSGAMRDQLGQVLDWLDTVILERWGR